MVPARRCALTARYLPAIGGRPRRCGACAGACQPLRANSRLTVLKLPATLQANAQLSALLQTQLSHRAVRSSQLNISSQITLHLPSRHFKKERDKEEQSHTRQGDGEQYILTLLRHLDTSVGSSLGRRFERAIRSPRRNRPFQPVRAFPYTTRGLFPAPRVRGIIFYRNVNWPIKNHECVDRRYQIEVGELNYAAGGSVYCQNLHRGF